MGNGPFEFIVIGSGAGGGPIFQRLALAGKKVLLLERGRTIPQEVANWDPEEVITRGRYRSPEKWQDETGAEFACPTFYCVGGNTKFYGATLMRFREEDFSELHHKEGVSPAWPVPYDDFEPFYQKAEELFRVRGKHGLDPSEPWSSAAYPFGAVPHDPQIQSVADWFKAKGLAPFSLPLGIEHFVKPSAPNHCIRCNTCGGFACKIHAKSDAQTLCVDPVRNRSNVTVIEDARVTKLETDASGKRVVAVQAVVAGVSETFQAETIIVACGAIQSAALLLASGNRKHPNGLGNSSGLVGRHYMRHLKSSVVGILKEKNTVQFQKTLGINDFYFGEKDFPWPMGHIQTLGRASGAALRKAGIKSSMPAEELAQHLLEFVVFSEDLPVLENSISLNSAGGIVVRYAPNNQTGHQRLIKKLESLLLESLCQKVLADHSIYVGHMRGPDNANHQCGTLRFGENPKQSVLNPDCRLHDVENVYVVDASFMPSSSATNPALTIIANSLRVADKLTSSP